MKFKYMAIFFFTLLCILILCFIPTLQKSEPFTDDFYFYVTTTSEIIIPYKYTKNDLIVFLPSNTEISNLKIVKKENHNLTINNTLITLDSTFNDITFEKEYVYTLNNDRGIIKFYKSDNTSTLFINTASGNTKHIDKENDESISLRLYNADGSINFSNNNSKIKGRGNSTWNYDKKPYSLTLPVAGNLLNMGEGYTWVLLANACDETNLRNAICYKLAESTIAQWTPKFKYVDLYINGKYNGLYLLCEKIEITNNRLNIDCKSGDFLCKTEFSNRYKTLKNPFYTANNNLIEISEPEKLSNEQKKSIKYSVNNMEKNILLYNNELQNIIDIDSWVCKYLIDEISGNVDSGMGSNYFYYCNDVFFNGPVWDYDLTFGNVLKNSLPSSFIAKCHYKSSGRNPIYYGFLLDNELFLNRTKELYEYRFLPELKKIINTEIPQLNKKLKKASLMNSLRWENMFKKINTDTSNCTKTTDEIIKYIATRIDFLNDVFINDTEYCNVQFEITKDTAYLNISVKKGNNIDKQKLKELNLLNENWIVLNTNKIFSFDSPITGNIILHKHINNNTDFIKLDKREYISIVFITILLIFFILIIQNYRKNKKGV